MSEPWYRDLPEGHRKRYEAREVIVSPGHEENRVFVVEQGRARICLFSGSREQTLGHLQPGSVYVTHTPAWVEALELTWTCSWPIQQITALFASRPEMALGAIREVGMMLNNTIGLIEDLAFRPVESRLARYLLTEARQQGSDTVRLIGNTEILGSLLGASRQTTSTILTRMVKMGLIARPDRQHVRLLNDSKLRELAEAVSAS